MPSGDIVTGCSDGVIRVFSESESRWASASDLKEYDEKVASQARPSQEVQGMKTSDASVLTQPGRRNALPHRNASLNSICRNETRTDCDGEEQRRRR